MAKRQRIDSASEQMKVAAATFRKIEPPSHIQLTDEQLVFFSDILDEFSKEEWTAHSLSVAAFLARDLEHLNKAQLTLEREGETVVTPKGGVTVNPLRTVVQTLSGSILNKRKALALDARSRKDPRDTAARRSKAKAIEDSVAAAADDDEDLIARPH